MVRYDPKYDRRNAQKPTGTGGLAQTLNRVDRVSMMRGDDVRRAVGESLIKEVMAKPARPKPNITICRACGIRSATRVIDGLCIDWVGCARRAVEWNRES